MDTKFDYVIVGGGTSGLVVAERLTEDPNISVLVLEAGAEHTTDPRIRTPAFWRPLLGVQDFDWCYQSVPQKALNGKVIDLAQGRLIGGSSAINGQAFVANSRAAMDAWAGFGSPGWDWETMGPYFKKFHNLHRPSEEVSKNLRLEYIDEDVRGTDGPVHASFPNEPEDPVASAWVDTLSALGYPPSGDPFSGDFTGGYINAVSVDPATATRSDAATAYYEPSKARPNLHVITGVEVQKLLFDTSGDFPRATGVQANKDGELITLEVRKEVILAAGVFGSAKLLELSGIGDRKLLEKLGIPLLVDNPNVGENLQDHPNVAVSFEVVDGVPTLDALQRQEPAALGAAMEEFATKQRGPFAIGGNYAGSLIPVPAFVGGPGADAALKQALEAGRTVPGDSSTLHAKFVHSILGKRSEGVANIFTYAACSNSINPGAALPPGNYLTLAAVPLFPLSRGSSHITSIDPSEKPAIDPKYFENPLDLEITTRLVMYFDTIINAEPLSKLLKTDGRRSAGAPDLTNAEKVKDYVKAATLTCFHPTSTCAMLPRENGGVVDSELRVYGVNGLRIVDSSIMPIAARGNPQTTVYAVAERAADLLKRGA